MKPICLILSIAALLAFARGSRAATRDDLIEAAKKDREVVFYTTSNLEEASAMSARFKAKYPFLDVNINRSEGERIVTKVLQETRAKKSLVDVLQTPAFIFTRSKKEVLSAHIPRPKIAFFRAASRKKNIGRPLTTIPTSFSTTRNSSRLKTCRRAMKICWLRSGKTK